MSKKLHEALAVESELANKDKLIRAETTVSFEKKENLFKGKVRRLEMFSETRKQEEAAGAEEMAVTESVMPKLEYTFGAFAQYLDVVLQKEEANQRASSDLVIVDDDGAEIVLMHKVPATFLLGLESKLAAIRPVLLVAPTLPPGINWVPDTQQPLKGVYRRIPDVITDKTEKSMKPVVLAAATDKHPAQVEKVIYDAIIGRFTVTEWSSAITPHDKSKLLERLDRLISAVKQARQRANCAEISDLHIGKNIVDFILGK